MSSARRPPAPLTESLRCAYCGGGLRHELLRFLAIAPEGTWLLCPRCVGPLVQRLDQAHAEAGSVLEAMWQAGDADDQ